MAINSNQTSSNYTTGRILSLAGTLWLSYRINTCLFGIVCIMHVYCTYEMYYFVLVYHYHIFPLLSACTYISTGRKPTFSSELRLAARYAYLKNTYTQIYMCIRGHI